MAVIDGMCCLSSYLATQKQVMVVLYCIVGWCGVLMVVVWRVDGCGGG